MHKITSLVFGFITALSLAYSYLVKKNKICQYPVINIICGIDYNLGITITLIAGIITIIAVIT
ncbi:MAG: hypothetical protein QW478_11405 [Candidatus Micrarchaeaceae archaeon]